MEYSRARSPRSLRIIKSPDTGNARSSTTQFPKRTLPAVPRVNGTSLSTTSRGLSAVSGIYMASEQFLGLVLKARFEYDVDLFLGRTYPLKRFLKVHSLVRTSGEIYI